MLQAHQVPPPSELNRMLGAVAPAALVTPALLGVARVVWEAQVQALQVQEVSEGVHQMLVLIAVLAVLVSVLVLE